MGLDSVYNENVSELSRCVRSFLDTLLGDLNHEEMKNMSLGLAHGLG